MKIKDLQKKLDDLTNYVKENPNKRLYCTILSVSGFQIVFRYFYNDIYGISHLTIRFYNFLSTGIAWYDYIPKNIEEIDAKSVYTNFISFVENELSRFQDELLNNLKSGVVSLIGSEIKWADLPKNGLKNIKYR